MTITFLLRLPHLHIRNLLYIYWTSTYRAALSHFRRCLCMWFLFVSAGFCSVDFLQTCSHPQRPCLLLAVPYFFLVHKMYWSARDLHPIVTAHAGHTRKCVGGGGLGGLCSVGGEAPETEQATQDTDDQHNVVCFNYSSR